jgi:hypothetical protein
MPPGRRELDYRYARNLLHMRQAVRFSLAELTRVMPDAFEIYRVELLSLLADIELEIEKLLPVVGRRALVDAMFDER